MPTLPFNGYEEQVTGLSGHGSAEVLLSRLNIGLRRWIEPPAAPATVPPWCATIAVITLCLLPRTTRSTGIWGLGARPAKRLMQGTGEWGLRGLAMVLLGCTTGPEGLAGLFRYRCVLPSFFYVSLHLSLAQARGLRGVTFRGTERAAKVSSGFRRGWPCCRLPSPQQTAPGACLARCGASCIASSTRRRCWPGHISLAGALRCR